MTFASFRMGVRNVGKGDVAGRFEFRPEFATKSPDAITFYPTNAPFASTVSNGINT